MIALFDVEVRRYLARRLSRVFALLALAGIALTGVLVFANTAESPVEDQFVAVELSGSVNNDPGVIAATAIVWAMISFVLGASFVGAEWRAGTMTTLLTWEPRRLRVFAAKALVAAGLGAAVVVVLDVVLGAALWPSVLFHGTTDGVDADFWRGIGRVLL
ncbi:MAG: hypothetical protein ACRDWD_07730, partial [Acidimicrobiia bacterium]